jgi:ABC-2 type transport system ATP-binding protein
VASHLWLLREGRLMWQGELDALKESVVRLHLRSASDIDPALTLPGQLQRSVQGRTAAFTVGGWSGARLLPLRDELGVEVEVEPLGLEDIFLAMHA